MRPVKRMATNKHKSANKFKRSAARTHGRNVAQAPMRGGWRL